jgi:hypothetical protein
MPIVGWSILLVIGAIITAVIIKNDAKLKKEAALKAQKKKEAVNV